MAAIHVIASYAAVATCVAALLYVLVDMDIIDAVVVGAGWPALLFMLITLAIASAAT
jgi:hypothetical protein